MKWARIVRCGRADPLRLPVVSQNARVRPRRHREDGNADGARIDGNEHGFCPCSTGYFEQAFGLAGHGKKARQHIRASGGKGGGGAGNDPAAMHRRLFLQRLQGLAQFF